VQPPLAYLRLRCRFRAGAALVADSSSRAIITSVDFIIAIASSPRRSFSS
jgi:hypothetical protein